MEQLYSSPETYDWQHRDYICALCKPTLFKLLSTTNRNRIIQMLLISALFVYIKKDQVCLTLTKNVHTNTAHLALYPILTISI